MSDEQPAASDVTTPLTGPPSEPPQSPPQYDHRQQGGYQQADHQQGGYQQDAVPQNGYQQDAVPQSGYQQDVVPQGGSYQQGGYQPTPPPYPQQPPQQPGWPPAAQAPQYGWPAAPQPQPLYGYAYPAPMAPQWQPRVRNAKANAFTALVLALATIGSLWLPWFGYGDSDYYDATFSGYDMVSNSSNLTDRLGDPPGIILLLMIAAGVLALLSLIRSFAPDGTAGLAAFLGVAVFVLAGLAVLRTYQTMGQGIYSDTFRFGQAVTPIVALVCAIVTLRGPAAVRSQRALRYPPGVPGQWPPSSGQGWG